MQALFAAAPEMLKFETAVLLLVVVGLLVLAKIVSDLRAEVRSLRGNPAPVSPALQTPASAVPASQHAAPSDEIPSVIRMPSALATSARAGIQTAVDRAARQLRGLE